MYATSGALDETKKFIVAICVILIILSRGGDVLKERRSVSIVAFSDSDEHVLKNVPAETEEKNESRFFDTHNMKLCCLHNVLRDIKCKYHNYVLQVWRKVDSLLPFSFRNGTRNSWSIKSQKIVSSELDQWFSCCVFSENCWKYIFPVSGITDVVVSWTQKWTNLVILLSIFVFFGMTHNLKKYEKRYSKQTRKELLFWFTHSRIQINVTTYPSSLDQYFSDIKKGTKENLMNYEWVRYATYKTFPETSVATPMRLAKAGFYYTGEGEETICFSCGLKNKHWNNHESVKETHKRLSPDCHFINGTDKTNVQIHASEPDKNEPVTSPPTGGACGGPSDAANDTVESEIPRVHNEQVPNENDINYNDRIQTKLPSVTPTSNYHNGNIERFPGVFGDKPNFPDFAIKRQRISTFSEWPESHPILPTSLAESGFFFTGPHDAVRCFFCGGGMKSWQYGDNPWIEHARWFPTCAYVRQFKGDDFVNMCRAANIDSEMYNQISQPGNETYQSNVITDRQIEDLNSVAAKTVLDMGYTQEQVEEAIRQHHQRPDDTEMRVQHLLEFLLDNTYTASQTEELNHKAKGDNNHKDNHSPKKYDISSASGDKDQNSLAEENEKLKEKMMCKICFDKDANIVFLPCGHMVSCVECAHAIRKCAVCRKLIEGRIRTFLA